MPSDTTQLPAREFRRLADEMAEHIAYNYLNAEGMALVEAYRAARQSSPVTLEEALITQFEDAHTQFANSRAKDAEVRPWFAAKNRRNETSAALVEHARALAEAAKGDK